MIDRESHGIEPNIQLLGDLLDIHRLRFPVESYRNQLIKEFLAEDLLDERGFFRIVLGTNGQQDPPRRERVHHVKARPPRMEVRDPVFAKNSLPKCVVQVEDSTLRAPGLRVQDE